MANKEIADLTAAGTLDGTEIRHIVQGGNSRKETVLQSLTPSLSAANQASVRSAFSAALKGHIHGLTLSNNSTDATNDIDIAAGEAASTETNPVLMVLASALTKRLDAAWAVGTGNGGLDTGTIADTTYYVWLIQRSDTGVVDALFSVSATSPTMPANYDRKRRIGAIIRVSGAILPFRQVGDEFTLKDIVSNSGTVTLSSTSALVTLRCPPNMLAKIQARVSGPVATWSFTITETWQTDAAASAINASLAGRSDGSTYAGDAAGQFLYFADASSQIRVVSSASSGTYTIATLGWTDTRGAN